MNRTKIEWTDFTLNPVTGCLHGCYYCYANAIAIRFKGTKAWPNGFKPTFHKDRLETISHKLPPSKIFLCSMGDLFGDWIPYEWIDEILSMVWNYPQHIFQFLTKNPKRYADFDFPQNCWLGTTVESYQEEDRIQELLSAVHIDDNIAFVSFEPLLGEIHHSLNGLDWIIIGALSGSRSMKGNFAVLNWAKELILRARINDIPVFVKDNLGLDIQIREFPRSR